MKQLLIALGVCAAAIGCASTSGNLADAASRLDRSASALYDEMDNDSDARSEAQEFAEAADDFERDVRDRKDREELSSRFESLTRSYHDLRDEISDDADSDEREAFDAVTRAYLDIQRELQSSRVSGL